MKNKKIETHNIGLVGQAPSRRGDPRKPLAGPNGQKIARLAGMLAPAFFPRLLQLIRRLPLPHWPSVPLRKSRTN
jgi:hypothetical protein